VLLLLAEDGGDGGDEVDRRVQRSAAMLGILPEKAPQFGLGAGRGKHDRNAHLADDLARNLYVHDVSSFDVSLQAAERDTPRETEFASELRNFLATNAGPDGWRLVVLDTLAKFGGPLAEKDNYAADVLMRTLDTLRAAPGKPTVLVLHHTNKGGLAGESDKGSTRGSSALIGGAKWLVNLEPVKGARDRVRLRMNKTNYGPGLGPMMLARDGKGFLQWIADEVEPDAIPKPPTTTAAPARTRGNGGNAAADRAANDAPASGGLF
jgi:hypothetical protein